MIQGKPFPPRLWKFHAHVKHEMEVNEPIYIFAACIQNTWVLGNPRPWTWIKMVPDIAAILVPTKSERKYFQKKVKSY